jgi:signal peptidase I
VEVDKAITEKPADLKPVSIRPSWLQQGFLRTLQSLSGTLVIAIFVITFILQAFQIPSESMEDTLLVGDYLLVDKTAFGQPATLAPLPYSHIHRGDVIVFRYPVDPSQHFVKRVVGVPGDRIHLRNGIAYVNGEALVEPYVVDKPYGDNFYRDNFPNRRQIPSTVTSEWWNLFPQLVRNGDLLVPEDHYFVLGDNRHNSSDSRFWGLVPRESIVGRPLIVYFSISPPPPATTPAQASDRIERFTARVWHLPEVIRWHRAFHFVR